MSEWNRTIGIERVKAGMTFREEPQPIPAGQHYCKYCYRTHANWFDDLDHDDGVFVCGCCQHASVLDAAAWEAHLNDH